MSQMDIRVINAIEKLLEGTKMSGDIVATLFLPESNILKFNQKIDIKNAIVKLVVAPSGEFFISITEGKRRKDGTVHDIKISLHDER